MSSILDSYPEYGTTSHLDTMRHAEYGYLDEQNHVYLDYTGSGLAARAQHRAHTQRQAKFVLGNPHSVSPTSELATGLVEKTRARILQHFNASEDEYAVIFTPNATGAARLIGEAYRYSSQKNSGKTNKNQKLVLTSDNHNSLNGLREYARRQGVSTAYVPSSQPDLHINPDTLLDVLGSELVANPAAKPAKANNSTKSTLQKFFSGVFCGLFGSDDADEDVDAEKIAPDTEEVPRSTDHNHSHERGLFAYPAQSNFSGVRHPLAWIDVAQRRGYDVLLDAAAYLPTSKLDLNEYHPDFVLVSWYKLFGYPTGVGCLVARREALVRLDRPWFSGGTIRAVSVGLDWHAPAHRLDAQFEDGTVNFQAIPDVYTGLQWLSDDVTFTALSTRVRCLTGWFLDRLVVLRHSNGQPMVRLYGPAHCLPDGSNRGGTVTFNFLDPHGAIVDERVVAAEAAGDRISLRTGCFCNPGAGETALGFSRAELKVLQHLAANSKPEPHGHSDHSIHSIQGHDAAGENGETGEGNAATKVTQQDGHARGSSLSVSSASDRSASFDDKALTSPPSTAASSAPSTAWPIAGAVRVSFGVASNTEDVDHFFAFARRVFKDKIAENSHLGPRAEC